VRHFVRYRRAQQLAPDRSLFWKCDFRRRLQSPYFSPWWRLTTGMAGATASPLGADQAIYAWTDSRSRAPRAAIATTRGCRRRVPASLHSTHPAVRQFLCSVDETLQCTEERATSANLTSSGCLPFGPPLEKERAPPAWGNPDDVRTEGVGRIGSEQRSVQTCVGGPRAEEPASSELCPGMPRAPAFSA